MIKNQYSGTGITCIRLFWVLTSELITYSGLLFTVLITALHLHTLQFKFQLIVYFQIHVEFVLLSRSQFLDYHIQKKTLMRN